MIKTFSPDPPSRISLAYFALAHLALAVAAGIMISVPESLAAFFFRPRVIATVHLVTLGWISSSILGALYMIAPMALRTRLAVDSRDWAAFVFYAVGLAGMVSHFWIHQPAGMVWSAFMVILALGWVGIKTVRAVAPAPIEAASRLAIIFAFLNLLLAAGVGVFMGWVQTHPSTTAIDFGTLAAHVLLAAIGWAVMMVIGAGYRLFPMLFPAAPPPRTSSLASVFALETGLLAMSFVLLAHRQERLPAVVLLGCGLLLFLANVIWMRLHPRPRARSLPRWDLGRLQIFEALVYLVLALALGAWLTPERTSPERLFRWFPVFAALLLVGFLGQMIAGVSARLFPLFLWIRSFKTSSEPPLPPPPGRLPSGFLTGLVLIAWSIAVPMLVCGLLTALPWPMRTAGSLLMLAVAASVFHFIAMTRRLNRARAS